jgi:DNA (cytosine-5)-methyltransferase 1
MRPAYYNEFDPQAAQWLRNLIAAGCIPAGDVDERSIADVHPVDLFGYAQHHFFAGIGGWALACRLAGWPDEREIWTGSPPCQPFSVAGQQRGAADERHLWPDLFRLVRAARPAVLMGEQVAAAVGAHWLDGVLADLEAIGYAGGACVVPACAVNAPHRRDRLWFVASDRALAHSSSARLAQRERDAGVLREALRAQPREDAADDGARCDVADSDSGGRRSRSDDAPAGHRQAAAAGDRSSAWDSARWLIGHDGKARRVEPGIRLLVDGLSPWLAHGGPSSATASRQAALKGFGNAIVPEVAAEVIAAWMECAP